LRWLADGIVVGFGVAMLARRLLANARNACARRWIGSQNLAVEAGEVLEEAGPPQVPLEPRPWSPDSRRCGVVAVKCGMMSLWDKWGVRRPITVLWIDECHVTQMKTEEKHGFNSLQVGIGSKKKKQVPRALLGHYAKQQVPIKRKLAEFQVTRDALLPVGTEINAAHFVAGQHVDVTGTTIGKGFQGPMKRHGFKGLPATHGVSLAHRSHGSTGQCQDPGKVFKGKKMAGQMGNDRRTVQNVMVYQVDPSRNLLYVVGQVPGHKGNFVLVKDAIRKLWEGEHLRLNPPFPTYIPNQEDELSVAVADVGPDPYEAAIG